MDAPAWNLGIGPRGAVAGTRCRRAARGTVGPDRRLPFARRAAARFGRVLAGALLLAGPALAGAAESPARGKAGAALLAVVRAPDPGGLAARGAEVDRALGEAVARVATPVPVPDRCGADDLPCLAALARSAGAGALLHVSLRPVGGTPSLLLLRVDAAGRPSARVVAPLRAGLPVEPPVREAVFRLLSPELVAGALEVDATEGSEIWIDGERRGLAPLPPIGGLAPGQHLLRVVRPGGAEARGTVEVRFEGTTRVRIEPRSDELILVAHDERSRAAEASGAGPALRPAELPRSPGGEGDPVPPAALTPAPEPFPVWTVTGWAAIGTGSALALGAVLPALAAARARDDARDLRDREGRLPPSRLAADRRLAADAASHDRTATALVAIGASLLAGGVTVLLLDLDAPAREAP